jgi:hypothetical protein
MSGEQALWQAVILQAVRDAESATSTRVVAPGETGGFGARVARNWILDCGKDFRFACALAGWDHDFISKAFREGTLTQERLYPEEGKRRRKRRVANA